MEQKFAKRTVEQIQQGQERGLSEEQITQFDKSGFDADKLQEIANGMRSTLTPLTKEQLEQIQRGREHGLSEEQIALFDKSGFDADKRQEIANGMRSTLTPEQIQQFAGSKPTEAQAKQILESFFQMNCFSDAQQEEILIGIRSGLFLEQLNLYARPEYDYRQMQQIRFGLMKGLSTGLVAIYAKPEFEWRQMEQQRLGLKHGLAADQVKRYAKPGFSWVQMQEIREGWERNLPEDEMARIWKEAEALPVGRLDFLDTFGEVAESKVYADPAEFLKDIRHENYHGAPISITLYRDAQGQTISQDFRETLDPPPQGFHVTDNPYLPDRISVLVVEPEKPPRLAQIEPGLESLQAQVNGNIKVVSPFEDPVAIICNENGKNDGLAFNRGLYDANGELCNIFAGTFLVTGLGGKDIASLSPELAAKYMEHFRLPEFFFHIGGDLKVFQGRDSGEAIQKMLDYVNGKAPGWDAPKVPENQPRIPKLN